MKKRIAVLLLLSLIAGLTGCSTDKASDEDVVKEELALTSCMQEAMQS